MLSTTLAVQKCACVPVVKNSAPTVGTPSKCTESGVPGGGDGSACGPAVICPLAVAAPPAPTGVALFIRATVQNFAVAACAGAATEWTAAAVPGAAEGDAPACPAIPTSPPVTVSAVTAAAAKPRARRLMPAACAVSATRLALAFPAARGALITPAHPATAL